MGRIAKEISGQVLCFLGFIGLCLCCGIPMWRVTSYIGANIVTGQIVWDGLWMQCVMQATGQMQCKVQSSIMSLTQDLQTAQALTVIAIVIGVFGLILTCIGSRCTSCLKNESSMSKVLITGGVLYIVAGVACLIPVCWSAAYTVQDYVSTLTIATQKREIGASVYIGWGACALLFLGGGLLCTSCPPDHPVYPNYPPMYPYQQPAYSYPGSYAPPSVAYSGPHKPHPGQAYAAVPGQYL